MSYGYEPNMVPSERFHEQFPGLIVQCLEKLGISDRLSESELREVLVYMNRNRPFKTNGTFSGFDSDSLLRAKADILHRLYSVWWAEMAREITLEEREQFVTQLCTLLAAAKARNWNRPEPMAASFSVG